MPVWELFSTGLEDKDRHRQVQTKKSDRQADNRQAGRAAVARSRNTRGERRLLLNDLMSVNCLLSLPNISHHPHLWHSCRVWWINFVIRLKSTPPKTRCGWCVSGWITAVAMLQHSLWLWRPLTESSGWFVLYFSAFPLRRWRFHKKNAFLCFWDCVGSRH